MLIDHKYVHRHEKGFIVCHWLNALAFIMLYLTALPLYSEYFHFFYTILSPYTFQILHRTFAVLFIVTPILSLFLAPKSMKHWAKQIVDVGLNDIKFFIYFPLEALGLHPKGMPKQGFYNAGEKLNSALQIFAWVLLVVSGLALWFGGASLAKETMYWMVPIHSAAAGLAFVGFIGHFYLAVFANPDSMRGMKAGNIHIRYAKHITKLGTKNLLPVVKFPVKKLKKQLKKITHNY